MFSAARKGCKQLASLVDDFPRCQALTVSATIYIESLTGVAKRATRLNSVPANVAAETRIVVCDEE